MNDFEKARKKDGEVMLDKEFAQKLKKDLQEKEEELMKNRNYQSGKKENNFTYLIVVGVILLLCSLVLGICCINKSKNINNTYKIEEINV